MTLLPRIFRFDALAAMLLLILAAGCSNHTDEPDRPFGVADAQAYLKLHLSVSSAASRANPTGGEIGDIPGGEEGSNHENDIEDFTIFIYDDADGRGLDSPSYTLIEKAYYADSDRIVESADGYTYTCPLESYDFSPTHRIVVAINAGDLTNKFSTLGQLRRHIAQQSRIDGEGNITSTRRFVMANALNTPDDGRVKLLHTGIGTPDSPNYEASCSVERLAARIDIMAPSADCFDTTNGCIRYSVASRSGKADLARLEVNDIYPINVMQRPSWLLKHLTPALDTGIPSDELLICADEILARGLPANYVIEPRTLLKSDIPVEAYLAEWYGATAAGRREKESGAQQGVLAAAMPSLKSINPAIFNGNRANITIAYADENTQPVSLHTLQYATGLLLKANYIPACIYRNAERSDSISDISSPTSFWRYRPTSRNFSEDICLYFSSKEAAQDYALLHPADMADIDAYPDGKCWYTVWIRHANDFDADPHADPIPMEYAIVRNNIYRLSFSFFGPGTPSPEIRHPETVTLRIFVRKWNLREQSQIVI